MWCPRLDHFLRFHPSGGIQRCGHMIDPPVFDTFEEMESSEWLKKVKDQFANDQWPAECNRCQQTEEINGTSIRLNSIKVDSAATVDNYLQVGGVLDNICNSACQMCEPSLSTKIGSLINNKNYLKVDNSSRFWNLPQDRIILLDINGGEPSASANYKKILNNLPPNLRALRVNTNGSKLIPELKHISQQGIEVTVTVSFDGIGLIHDYVRWPIKWEKFQENFMAYMNYGLYDVNFWTTVNALNINDLENILNFVQEHSLNHSYALLHTPSELNIGYKNWLTTKAREKYLASDNPELRTLAEKIAVNENNETVLRQFIDKQDKLRNISIENYINTTKE
jgi:sulfatase maturation enzyme AslB (radical SAM superfamily)